MSPSRSFAFHTLIAGVLTATALLSPGRAAAGDLRGMPRPLDARSALEEARRQGDLELYLVSASPDSRDLWLLDVLRAEGAAQIRPVARFSEVARERKYRTLWIARSEGRRLLRPGAAADVAALRALLAQGSTSLFFVEPESPDTLRRIFTGSLAETPASPAGTDTPQVFYLSRNEAGETFTGMIRAASMDATVVRAALASAWNRRNDGPYTRKAAADGSIAAFAEIAAASGTPFTIGSNWRLVYGWENNEYLSATIVSLIDRGKVVSDRGTFSEWRAVFYLTNPVDRKDYYAYAGEVGMMPRPDKTFSDRFSYASRSDAVFPDLIRDYEPKAVPSESTYTFQLGLGLYPQVSGSAGISWSYTRRDLEITDQTTSSTFMKLLFRYPTTWFWQPTAYARQTSWNNLSFIYQNATNRGYVSIDTSRSWRFKDVGCCSTYEGTAPGTLRVWKSAR